MFKNRVAGQMRQTMTRRYLAALGLLGLISATSGETMAASSYRAAAVLAKPGLQCNLAPENGLSPSGAVAVSTDHDGFARFYAVRATPQDAVQRLTLSCKDASGAASSYSVDLTAAQTFAAHPLNLAEEPGTDRPALQGDPMSFTQAQLLEAGYGLRPDPENASAYSRWLSAASRSGRLLVPSHPTRHPPSAISPAALPNGTASLTAPYWTGSVLQGDPKYDFTEASFNVPTAVPGGDMTTVTALSIWNGLGGFNTGSGLIQGGATIYTTPAVASYGIFREYCCGDPDSNGYGGAFTPKPGDQLYSEEWYCDAAGAPNINGGYGCTFLENLTSGAILNCSKAAGTPCWSVKALPLCSVNPNAGNCMTLGADAEFIIENQSPQVSTTSTAFTDLSPVTMAGSAYSLATKSYQTISTDPSVYLLTDFTDTTTRMTVSLGTSDQTYFSVAGTADTIRSFTGAACGAFCDGWTTLDDNASTKTIVASNNNLYQIHTTGSIWKSTGAACSGTYCPGWTKYDDNAADTAIAADGNSLFKLETNGQIWKSTGAPCNSKGCNGWTMLDNNPLAVQIAASGGNLYELHGDGQIWKSTGVACSGTYCPGWYRLDFSPDAISIVADGSKLYQLQSNGQVLKWDGAGCTGALCPSWTLLDNNPLTVQIAAAGGHLYELHSSGQVWKSTGVACSGTYCPGWTRIDDNAATTAIVAEGNNLYQLHDTGSVWQWEGGGCTGASCPSWTKLDANPLTVQIAAGGNHLYGFLR
jgi:hypothetical protein